LQAVCTQGLNLFRLIMIYLKPVLPRTAIRAEQFLRDSFSWEARKTPLLNCAIAPFSPLLTRIDPKQINAMVEAAQENLSPTESLPQITNSEPLMPEISYEHFAAIDLRVARIISAEEVSGADKLLRLTLDLGENTRTVFAGIKSAYQPANLIGRLTVVVANLAPRTLRFGISEGMVLAAGPGGKEIFLLAPDQGARPGMKIK